MPSLRTFPMPLGSDMALERLHIHLPLTMTDDRGRGPDGSGESTPLCLHPLNQLQGLQDEASSRIWSSGKIPVATLPLRLWRSSLFPLSSSRTSRWKERKQKMLPSEDGHLNVWMFLEFFCRRTELSLDRPTSHQTVTRNYLLQKSKSVLNPRLISHLPPHYSTHRVPCDFRRGAGDRRKQARKAKWEFRSPKTPNLQWLLVPLQAQSSARPASSLLPSPETIQWGLLAHHELITLSACLRPHQACPVAHRASIHSPPCLWLPTNPRSITLLILAPGHCTPGQQGVPVTWGTLPNLVGCLNPNPNPTVLTNFESSRQKARAKSRLRQGRENKTDETEPWGPLQAFL